MTNKTTLKRLKLDPYFNKTIDTNLNVWSHDQNSYEIKFEFYDHQCNKPIDLTGADMRILLDHAGSQPKIYPLEIESKVLGLAKFIMPEQIRGCEGKFTAHIYADYPNKTHDFGSFTFYTQLSKIDKSMGGCLDTVYVSEFEKALEKFKEIEQKIEQNDLVTQTELNERTHTKKYIDENLRSLSERNEQLALNKANKNDVLTKEETKELLSFKADKQKTEASLNELERKKADQSFVDAQLSSIVSGAPKGTYKTLQALKEAYPNGTEGVFLVLENGHWYYYANGWQDGGVYQANALGDNYVEFQHLDDVSKKLLSSRYLNMNETPDNFNFLNFVFFELESGNLAYSGGGEFPDKTALRTNFLEATRFTILNHNNQFKYQVYIYNSQKEWEKTIGFTNIKTKEIDIDEGKYIRIVIQKENGLEIIKKEGYNTLNIAKTDNKIEYQLNNLFKITDYQINIGGGAKPKFKLHPNYTIDITMPDNNLHFFENDGNYLKISKQEDKSKTFSVKNNQILIWDLTSNEFIVLGNSDRRPRRSVVLANSIYGDITNGYFSQFWKELRLNSKLQETDYKHNFSIEPKLEPLAGGMSQGMTVINGEVWSANGAADDHSTYSSIGIFGNDLKIKGKIVHNISHMNTIDYNKETDVLLIGNASDNTKDNPPKLFLVRDVNEIPTDYDPNGIGYKLEYDDDRVLEIPLFKENDAIHPYGVGACFGETSDIVYLFLGGYYGTDEIVKVMLGKGSNKLEDYGNFITAEEGQYNGTIKVLSRHKGSNLLVNQDCFYHNGHIYGSFGRYEAKLAKIKLTKDSYKIVDSYELPNYDKNGNTMKEEPNGACLLNGIYFLTSFKGKFAKIPFKDRQGGFAAVGEKIFYDFKMNTIPIVNITSLSDDDIYISEINTDYFLVKSSNGKLESKFIWECSV